MQRRVTKISLRGSCGGGGGGDGGGGGVSGAGSGARDQLEASLSSAVQAETFHVRHFSLLGKREVGRRGGERSLTAPKHKSFFHKKIANRVHEFANHSLVH